MPPTAVLSGLMILTGYCTSHATVSVPGTEWEEPILVWISIGMPTGSGKSPLYKFLLGLLRKCRRKVGLDETQPPWLLDEATFEKMRAMMSDNHCKLVGLYDELSSQINLYKGRGLSDSHDLSLFLQLYNGHPWARKTGMHTLRVVTTVLNLKCKDSISLHFKTGQTPQFFNSCLMSELL